MKHLLTCAVLLLCAHTAHAQGVGINTTGAAADTSAILDLSSTAKGFLPPRMTTAQRTAVVLPATGLLVYQTDGTAGLYYNTGTPAAPNWKQVGEAGSGGSSQWTTNGANIYYGSGNVGIQRGTPLARLDVLGGNWDVVGGEGDVRIGDGATRLKFGLATGGNGTGAATIMEHGPAGAYNVLALGTQGNKVLFVNGNTQRAGIGTDAPTAPLGFASVLGKKISLFANGSNDYGLGISSTRLQIFSDGWPGGDVAIGTDAAGTFTERLAIKNNGALAVSGNTGTAGQVLQSNGSGAAASWTNLPARTAVYQATGTTSVNVSDSAWSPVPGLTQTFTTTAAMNVITAFSVPMDTPSCFACGANTVYLQLVVDGTEVNRYKYTMINNSSMNASATWMVPLAAGTHTIYIAGLKLFSTDVLLGFSGTMKSSLVVTVAPQ